MVSSILYHKVGNVCFVQILEKNIRRKDQCFKIMAKIEGRQLFEVIDLE